MEEIKRRQMELERFKDDMETAIGQVFYILRESEQSRNNDGILLVQWLKLFKGVDSYQGIVAMALNKQLNFETIRRCRQKIQSAGFCLPDDEAVIKRRRLQEVWRVVMGGAAS